MISLSKRLESISKYIDDFDKVIDIGCDHALLDIFLVQNRKKIFVVASDIIPSAIEIAKKNVKDNGLLKRISLRCGDGFNVLTESDFINTVVISGMGHQKIVKILKEGKKYLNTVEKIVIQSNTFPSKVREYVVKNGYYIFDEKLVKDNNIIYTVLVFKKGTVKYNKKQIELGPILIKNNNKLFNELLDIEIKKNIILLSIIPRKYFLKRFKIKRQQKLLLNEKNPIEV